MAIERIMKYECRVCGRKIDVTRTGDVYEEPVYCCGLEATDIDVPQAPSAPKAVPMRKLAAKKAKKKTVAKKAAKKKAVTKKAVTKKATKKKAATKKAAKKAVKKKTTKKRR